jgi:hypothetical protein
MANDGCCSRLSVSLSSLVGKTGQVTRLRNLICAVLVILSAWNVAAQQITGSIRGTVSDPSGAVVQDA